MKIKVTDEANQTYEFDIDKTDNFFMLKSKLAVKMGGVGVNSLKLYFNGQELQDFNNFVQSKVEEGSTLQVKGGAKPARPQQQAQSQGANPFAAFNQNPALGGGGQNNAYLRTAAVQEANKLRAHFAANSSELNMLLEQDPELAQAILSDDPNATVEFLLERVDFIDLGQDQKTSSVSNDAGRNGSRCRSYEC